MATVYPFDPSGTSSANRIINEQQVITAQNFRDYHYVIPNFAPFFEDNFTIKLQFPDGTQKNLVLGIDYYFSNQFLDASRACAKPIYGSISFLDTDTAGILSISYNTVGGMWNVTPAEITRILAEEMRNPRITTWEQITYLPERFPVVDHQWDLIDMVGMSKVVTSIDDLRAAVLAANGGGLTDHVNNYSNPHNVTAAQVGLGNVQNFPVASTLQAQDGTSNAFYMTPLRVKDAIQAIGGAMLNTHASDTTNPHQTTKAQVGLTSVQDFPVASTAQAQAGAVDNAYMTPLKVSQAVAALVGNAYAAHAANQLNPHNVTKDQVGLFNVQNYPVATQLQAITGTDNATYMTPLRTTQLVQQYVTVQLDGHAARTDNPHQTTAAQVGLGNVQNYAVATQGEAQAAVSNSTYMTPGRTRDTIVALAAPIGHLADMNNPHQVTAAQVGAYSATQTDTLLGGYVTLNAQWVAGMTKAAFVAEVLSGTAAQATNATKVYGFDFNQLIAAEQVVFDARYASNSGIDNRYANTKFELSRDASTTVDPVGKPYRWLKLGTVETLTKALTGSAASIATTHPEAYWFFTGGNKQEATAAANAAASSPAYLIHAKNGLALAPHGFDVTRMNGTADTDVLFGYTFDGATGVLSVWVRVAYAYNDVQVTRLAGLANTVNIQVDADVEPAGITYVAPVAPASGGSSDLEARVAALEATVNSVNVA